jgi:hypothetical protein
MAPSLNFSNRIQAKRSCNNRECVQDEDLLLYVNRRNTASGLPALFRKRSDTSKEGDVELGEKEDLLEKTTQETEVGP